MLYVYVQGRLVKAWSKCAVVKIRGRVFQHLASGEITVGKFTAVSPSLAGFKGWILPSWKVTGNRWKEKGEDAGRGEFAARAGGGWCPCAHLARQYFVDHRFFFLKFGRSTYHMLYVVSEWACRLLCKFKACPETSGLKIPGKFITL